MKSLSILTMLVFFFLKSFMNAPEKIEADGIKFQNISFQNALQKAKKENKLLFVNVYAVWCGPCKLLKQNTFTSKKVADAVNSNFISLDIDAEKGEGINFAKKYQVTAHPLVLIIDGNGKVKKRILGYKKDVQFLAEIKEFL